MLVSESSELNLDRTWAPHQFSIDYGAVQDDALNTYVADVGRGISARTHRPTLPYNFRALNSVVVNGYTFPAGSVGLARGLLLAMDNEAQLAAVLGHEMGHVNARHTGSRMTKSMIAMWVVAGVAAYVQVEREKYADLAAGLGAVGAQALLARYSRSNEREADSLGMQYMSKADHNPRGMVDLMNTLRKLRKTKPSAVELLFATHPLGEERYQTASRLVETDYAQVAGLPLGRERFMDRTASLRAIRGAVESMQFGETSMKKGKPVEAEVHFGRAVKQAPDDYAALLMMAKCTMAQRKGREAESYASRAKTVYPGEPQALHVNGMAKIANRKFDGALAEFAAYEKALPGNPNTVFFKGYCYESMGRRMDAITEYERYLQAAPSGEYAGHVRKRLTEWGVLKPRENNA